MSTPAEQLERPPAEESRTAPLPTNKSLGILIRILIAAAIAFVGIFFFTAGGPQHKDYISYWSAGQLLKHGADPYSTARVLALEKTQGYSQTRPLIMRNPPWSLFLAVPLGWISAKIGLYLWMVAAIAAVFLSLHLLDVPQRDRPFAFFFAPTLSVFITAQTSFFLLLGFCLFLRLYRNRPFFAGVSLLLLAAKPHLFILFWVVLVFDCIYRRRFRLAAGAVSALAAASAVAMWLDPHVWQHYAAMLRDAGFERLFIPTISVVFRLHVDPKAHWLQLVPSAIALVWACWYYARNRRDWDWRTNGLLLMLVTLLVSPYSWFPDEIVLLPSIAFGLSQRRKYSFESLTALNGVALLLFLMIHIPLTSTSGAYLWTPTAWLVWFLYATGRSTSAEPGKLRPTQASEVQATS